MVSVYSTYNHSDHPHPHPQNRKKRRKEQPDAHGVDPNAFKTRPSWVDASLARKLIKEVSKQTSFMQIDQFSRCEMG